VGWTEFSCILRPSPLGGVGVFAIHDIPLGSMVFNEELIIKRTLKIKDVPKELLQYCIYKNDEECIGPERFDRMEIAWYLNHSATPNIAKKNLLNGDTINDRIKKQFYAIKDIKAGDEILIDYNYLNEPEHLKEVYYKR
jgi:SET domain-containing protein